MSEDKRKKIWSVVLGSTLSGIIIYLDKWTWGKFIDSITILLIFSIALGILILIGQLIGQKDRYEN